MSQSLDFFVRLSIRSGCRSCAVFEQLVNFIQMGKYSVCPGIDIPAIGQVFIDNGCTSSYDLEQVRTLLDQTIRIDINGSDDANAGYYIPNNSLSDSIRDTIFALSTVQNPLAIILNGDYFYGFHDPLLTSVSFPDITEAGEIYYAECRNLVSVSFPMLNKVSGNVVLWNDTSMASLDLGLGNPGTLLVDNSVVVVGASGMASLNLSKLQKAMNIVVTDNDSLTSIDLSGLTGLYTDHYNDSSITFKNNKIQLIILPSLTFSSPPVRPSIYISYEPDLSLVRADLLDHSAYIRIEHTKVTQINFPELLDSYGESYLDNNSLVALFLPKLQSVYFGDLSIVNAPHLLLVNLPELQYIYNGSLKVEDTDDLLTILCPNLLHSSTLSIVGNTSLIGVAFPLLYDPQGITVNDNPALVGLSFPGMIFQDGFCEVKNNASLQYLRALNCTFFRKSLVVDNCASLALILFPLVEKIGWNSDPFGDDIISITNCPVLLTVDFSGLIAYPNLQGTKVTIKDCASLTSASFGSWIPRNNISFDMRSCNWTSAFINDILARCVANPGYVSGTIDFRSNPNGPSGQGVVDWQTLSARGVDVKII